MAAQINQTEIDRLNKRLQEITSDLIRIVYYGEENGCKMIFDIIEFNRKWVATKITNKLSKSGIRFVGERIPTGCNWSLVEFEKVGVDY